MPLWTCQGCSRRVRTLTERPDGWRVVTAAGLPVCGAACEAALRAELADPVAVGHARRRPLTVRRAPRGRGRDR